jgi:hypothetical protein
MPIYLDKQEPQVFAVFLQSYLFNAVQLGELLQSTKFNIEEATLRNETKTFGSVELIEFSKAPDNFSFNSNADNTNFFTTAMFITSTLAANESKTTRKHESLKSLFCSPTGREVSMYDDSPAGLIA